MLHYLLDYKSSTISCYRFGKGPRPVICFHGYGESAASYAFLEKHCGEVFTFYSIDLPFHGATIWNEEEVCKKDDLKNIVDAVLEKGNQDIMREELKTGKRNTDTKYTLMGFSLGGRIALTLFQSIPDKVGRIVLLAPDGLKVNFWYWLSTQTFLGNKLFAFTMRKPGWFFGFLKALNKMGMVNASVFKFVNYYIGNPEVRHFLYVRWTALRKLKPDIKRIKSLIKRSGTQVRLIYGKHDRIIMPEVGKRFQKDIEQQCVIEVIGSGHQVLQEKYADNIVAQLID